MLINSFKSLFDNIQNLREESVGYFVVNENNEDSTLETIKIEDNDCTFTTYQSSLIKSMPSITSDRSSHIKDKDCDGTIFKINDKNEEELIFAELKSTFSNKKINEAYLQLLYSFLKIHMLLSVCKDYNLSKIPIKFIVACKTFKDDDQEAKIWSIINESQTLNKKDFDGQILGPLLCNEYIDVNLGDFPDIAQNQFGDDIKNKKIQMRLCLTKNYNDNSIVTNL